MKVFIAHSSQDVDLVASLMSILREHGHDVFDPAGVTAGANVLSEIAAGLRSADVLVAVVRGGNPNIFYELGLATGASVPILIAAPAGEPLPADLSSVPYVQLAGDTLRDSQMVARRVDELGNLARTGPLKYESAEAALRAAVQEPAILESLNPVEFERLVMELFKERGYAVTAVESGRDIGIDFAIKKDNKLVLVEVKKLSRQSRVSVETVRRLLEAISTLGASLGILVATSGYTTAAVGLAAGTPVLLRTIEEILAAKSSRSLLRANARERRLVSIIKQNRDRWLKRVARRVEKRTLEQRLTEIGQEAKLAKNASKKQVLSSHFDRKPSRH
jgi:hypothetical protein